MKISKVILAVTALLLVSCGGSDNKRKAPDYSSKSKKTVVKKKEEVKKTTSKKTATVDLSNKGIGPVKSADISKPIDKALADKGAELFKNKCTACHRTTKKFIGPNPTGVLKRRSPEWVMNMIMNPEEMIQKDPIAKQLLIEYNGSPMANQNVKKDEARAILEYFRTLK